MKAPVKGTAYKIEVLVHIIISILLTAVPLIFLLVMYAVLFIPMKPRSDDI